MAAALEFASGNLYPSTLVDVGLCGYKMISAAVVGTERTSASAPPSTRTSAPQAWPRPTPCNPQPARL
jgi:hypothetical protein